MLRLLVYSKLQLHLLNAMSRELTIANLNPQQARWLSCFMALGAKPEDGPEAAKRAGLADTDEDAIRVSAILTSSDRIQKVLKDEVQKRFVLATNMAFDTILSLARNGRNESVRLAAAKELLEKAGIVTVSRSAIAVGVTTAEDLLAALEERQRALAAGEPDPYGEPIEVEFAEVF